MKRTHSEPEMTVIGCSPCNMLAATTEGTVIRNDSTGGDDGQGGYDPGSSLSRDNGNSGNNPWNNAW